MKKFLSGQILLAPLYWCVSMPLASASENIEEFVITASPHGKTSGDIAGSLNILSGEQLQREVASTLGDTLKNQIGINTSSFGPGVGLPVIRGLSGSRVEVLQNSSPVADASRTSPDHAIAFEPMLADRIEILRGPSALRYGPGAIGGVVNIIDNRIHTAMLEEAEGAFEARHNDNNHGEAYIGRVDGGSGAFSLHASGIVRDSGNISIPGRAAESGETTHGYVANTDTKANAWNLGISYIGDAIITGLAISRLDNNYGIPPGGHQHLDEEHEEHDIFARIDMVQTDYSGKLLFPNLPGAFNTLDIDLSHTEYHHRELELEETTTDIATRYGTNTDHLRAELTHGSKDSWLGALGLQASSEEFIAEGEESFVPPNTVRIAGLFITQEKPLGSGTLSLGTRYDRQTADPDGNSDVSHSLFNASASYLWPIDNRQQLSLVATHAQRAPSAEELFAAGAHAATSSYLVGDSHLNRESANSLEITWRYEGTLTINASLYHREFSDFIYAFASDKRLSHDLNQSGATGASACSADLAQFDHDHEHFEESLPCFFYQQEDARFSGVELEVIAPLTDAVSLRLWGDAVKARLEINGDAPRIPPARAGVNLDYDGEYWLAGISFTRGFAQNHPGINEESTKDYSRLDAHLGFALNQWNLFLKATNLTDREIRNATSFLRAYAPEPGRSIEAGIRYTF